METKGTLYIVSTPIGNLEDITLRALRVLKEADLIVAEDTRRTWKLLNRYNISATLTSYFEHNELTKGLVIISRLKEGKDVALVSDAGTPNISDPGYRLVKLAIENSIKVTSIPGPSAIISALSISGLPTDSFAFYGFVPRKSGARRTFLGKLKEEGKTVIIYESPYRVMAVLKDILTILGDIDGVMVRELTKLYEEVIRGKISEIIEALKDRTIKGEVTFILGIKDKKRLKKINT